MAFTARHSQYRTPRLCQSPVAVLHSAPLMTEPSLSGEPQLRLSRGLESFGNLLGIFEVLSTLELAVKNATNNDTALARGFLRAFVNTPELRNLDDLLRE